MKNFTLVLLAMSFMYAKAQNPVLLKDVRAGSGGSATTQIVPTSAGYTFFNADDDGDGIAGLWRTDGTKAGTQKINLVYPGYITSGASLITPLGSKKVFFAGDNGFGYGEAWVSDGTAAGTIALERSQPGSPAINVAPIMDAAALGSQVIYAMFTNDNHIQLKKTNGSNVPSQMVYDFGADQGNGTIALMKASGGFVYFDLYNAQNNGADIIMVTDGNNTLLVANLSQIPGASSPYSIVSNFMPAGDGVYFIAINNEGTALFKASGTGTLITAEIVKKIGTSYKAYPSFAAIGSTLYFAADDGTHGTELWKTDGTAAGTGIVNDIVPGAAGSNLASLTVMNNTLYFTANVDLNQDGLAKETAICRLDGTTVSPMAEVSPDNANVPNIGVVNNTLLFSVATGDGSELWVGDGTGVNTEVADINPGSGSSSPSLFTTVGNSVYFKASNGANGQEIFKYTAPTKIWTGFVNSDWTEAGNWIPATAPAATDDVLIGPGVLANASLAFCNNLTVNGMLASENGLVFVNGDLYNKGAINMAPNGKIIMAYNASHLNHLLGSPGNFAGELLTQLNTVVTLTANTAINGALNFETPAPHEFHLGNYNLKVNEIKGATNTAYVVTDGKGALTLNNVGSTQTTFPIGASNTSYTPVSITNAGTADNFSARVMPNVLNSGTTGDTVRQEAVNRTWLLDEEIPGGSNVTVTAQWNAADELPLFNRNTAYLGHYTGGKWDAGTQGTASGTNPYTFSRSGITSFSPFAVSSSANILPVSIAGFTVTRHNTDALISWKTTYELNSSYFNIQRSQDGAAFATIGTQTANGRSSVTRNYSYVDNIAKLNGTIYYRLQEVDKDGKTTLSPVRSINIGGSLVFSFSPNPAKSIVKITGNVQFVQVYDMLGKLIISKPVTASTTGTTVNISALSKGTYLMVAKDAAGNSQTQKLIVE